MPVCRVLVYLRKPCQVLAAICYGKAAILVFLCTVCDKEHSQTSLPEFPQQPLGRKQEGMQHIQSAAYGKVEGKHIYWKMGSTIGRQHDARGDRALHSVS